MTYILKWVDQTGWKQDLYFDYTIVDWLHLRTGRDRASYIVGKNRMRLGPQLRLTDDSQNRLRTGSKRGPQYRMRKVDSRCTKFSSHLGWFKNLCIFSWLIFFIDSCVNAKRESFNYTHTKERFSWKRLGALSQKQTENNDPGYS